MIEVKNLVKYYGRKRALNGISFSAKKGEVTCLLGINGVGKSTTLRNIMGLTPYQSGSILIDGQPVKTTMYEKVAFIPDKSTMPFSMTIKQAFDFMNDYYESWDYDKAYELLSFFKLADTQKFGELSSGNCAKANMVIGLALKTEYVILDEPFSGIDIFSREQIISVFTSELLDGQGVLLTTHEIHEIENIVDKVILLDQGSIIKEFYPEEERSNNGKSVVDIMREVYNA